MIVELGHILLILTLPMAVLLSLAPLFEYRFADPRWGSLVAPLVTMIFVALTASFAALAYAFMTNDFSVNLVASHSNTRLPSYFQFSAVWGNHEGSLLLWVWILAGWTFAVLLFGRELPREIQHRVLAVLGAISVGFLAFIVFTSNPFTRNLLTTPAEGADLNPLLQDPGLIFHPPLLYTGYVGFAVAFAFAITALISGKLDAAWARWSRPWTNTAWAFLTIGIALGSWWAYYELGWGGWWFWDPVENASFMPWIAGTALIHSLAATEKRGVFRSWTVLLAILAFSLSLLGTFLVRSGILVSVHAFAADPTRGLFILAFLIIVIGSSLLLYAVRVPAIKSQSSFAWNSRESFLLVNNVLLSVSLVVVLVGTLFPLVMNALDLGSYSVGAPYFNAFSAPIGLPMLLLMGIAPFLFWQRTGKKALNLPASVVFFFVSVCLGWIFTVGISNRYDADFSLLALLSLAASIFLILMTIKNALQKMRRGQQDKDGKKRYIYRPFVLTRSYWGMVVAHIGVAVSVIGIALTSVYSLQQQVSMKVGDSFSLGPYRYQLEGFETYQGPNFVATRGTVEVFYQDTNIATVFPEKRRYMASQNVMTEAGIAAGFLRDIYVSLGDPIEANVWAVSLQIKAYVRWIWLGSILMSIGAVLAIADRRYRAASLAS